VSPSFFSVGIPWKLKTATTKNILISEGGIGNCGGNVENNERAADATQCDNHESDPLPPFPSCGDLLFH